MSILIVEGVTGAGKTATIKALQEVASFDLVDEDATFDDFMSAFFADPDAATRRAHDRMAAILDKIEARDGCQPCVLERFYFSQLALGGDSHSYEDIEKRCIALSCKVVVLANPDDKLMGRSLFRSEYEGEDWQQLVPHYGSKEMALEAIQRAQKLRIDAIKQSHLEYRVIETSEMAWARYAIEIADWAGWARRHAKPPK